jgi:prepilin-type N-terminal cleavage/methylation domain-containing protein
MQCIVQLGRRAGCIALGRRDGQAGFTLLEVVISVALVSLVVLGLATGFITLVRTNGSTYRQQQVDHAATNFAESLKAVQYQPCVPAGADPDYGAAPDLWAPSDDLQVEVVDVEYWDPAEGDFDDTCVGADAGAQRVTVRAEWRDRERQAQIVKRNR